MSRQLLAFVVVPPAHSTLPFTRAFRQLMAERDLSFRRLEPLTKTINGKGLSQSYLNQLATGQKQPTVENMYVIARAAGVDPRFFVEYREHLAAEAARRLATEVGLDEVLAKLAELEENGSSAA